MVNRTDVEAVIREEKLEPVRFEIEYNGKKRSVVVCDSLDKANWKNVKTVTICNAYPKMEYVGYEETGDSNEGPIFDSKERFVVTSSSCSPSSP